MKTAADKAFLADSDSEEDDNASYNGMYDACVFVLFVCLRSVLLLESAL